MSLLRVCADLIFSFLCLWIAIESLWLGWRKRNQLRVTERTANFARELLLLSNARTALLIFLFPGITREPPHRIIQALLLSLLLSATFLLYMGALNRKRPKGLRS